MNISRYYFSGHSKLNKMCLFYQRVFMFCPQLKMTIFPCRSKWFLFEGKISFVDLNFKDVFKNNKHIQKECQIGNMIFCFSLLQIWSVTKYYKLLGKWFLQRFMQLQSDHYVWKSELLFSIFNSMVILRFLSI